MKLSIIIPCYKVEQYLDQCLESVTHNKTQDVEIILVDDGSPDRVPEMCDEWANKDSRIRVIHQKNGGLSVARNTGLEASTGEYVWFIDSDDWITDDAIERVFSLINEYLDTDVFVFPLKWTYEDSRKDWIDVNVLGDCLMSCEEYAQKFPYATGASPRNIIKRTLIDSVKLRFCANIIHEDALFGIILYDKAEKLYVCKDYIYNYLQRNDSIMHSITIRTAYSYVTIHQQLMLYLNEQVEEKRQNAFRVKYIWVLLTSITNTFHLRNTLEFKKFLEETSAYRITECRKCFNLVSGFQKIEIRLLSYHPLFLAYIKLLPSMIYKSAKYGLKDLLQKIGMFDKLYDLLKGKNHIGKN